MEVNEEDSSGGLIGHCVPPQPWREIDAHGYDATDAVYVYSSHSCASRVHSD